MGGRREEGGEEAVSVGDGGGTDGGRVRGREGGREGGRGASHVPILGVVPELQPQVFNQRLHDCFPLLAEGSKAVGRDTDAAVGGATTL